RIGHSGWVGLWIDGAYKLSCGGGRIKFQQGPSTFTRSVQQKHADRKQGFNKDGAKGDGGKAWG
ncbi:MAG: hypothetical protein NZU63_06910, partial [Gemmataceae bacterium]|nr:hypothetical protein [Gemmataceae bacterium]